MIIETSGLVKKYGKFTAVDNVSISVNKGEIYGFLGLNGAGKTTTIKSLLGLSWPTAGRVSVCGVEISRSSRGPWDKVGSLVEVPSAYPELTVRQNLEIFRRMRGLDAGPDPVKRIIDKLKLSRYQEKKAGQLSLGNQQRLGLAKALIHGPEVLILDEPANGLDPAGIVEIRSLFADLALNNGVTIFVSSHHLSEISKTASRIGIIHEGKLIQELKTTEIESRCRKLLKVKVRDLTSGVKILASAGYACDIDKDSQTIFISQEDALKNPENVARVLVETNHPPVELIVSREDLEAYFLRIISKDL